MGIPVRQQPFTPAPRPLNPHGSPPGTYAARFRAGSWESLARNAGGRRGNPRLARPSAGLARLADREALLAEAAERGDDPP